MKKQILSALLSVVVLGGWAQSIDVIPRPVSIKTAARSVLVAPQQKKPFVKSEYYFKITPETKIMYAEGLAAHARLLSDYLSPATGFDFEMIPGVKAKKRTILITIDTSLQNAERYQLKVTTEGIDLVGGGVAGVSNGIQTLLQLLPSEVYSATRKKEIDWIVPEVEIDDYPQFGWRGAMLDVSRYFIGKDAVLRFIDMMAMYKMNLLHLHLVDDSGWRLEIKKYPLLTEIGGFRGEGTKRTGGFYTQQEIKEMIEYAALRNIMIVPEIEFPAHILSAISAYPWLGCRGLQHNVPEQHFISKDLICVGKEQSIQFLKDVIEETCQLFPSKYIHIGGDEAVYDYWDECPDCSALRDKLGLKKSGELQSYLTNVVADFAAKYNRTIVGWDEIAERGKVNHKVVSMVWRSPNNTEVALSQGHDVVFALADYHYFDFPESRTPGEVKSAMWKGPISVEKCYKLDLSPFENNPSIKGVHACMWTDQFIHGTILQEIAAIDENRAERYIEYFMLPRLAAISESAWLPTAQKDYIGFQERLKRHYKRLRNAGFSYRVPEPVLVATKPQKEGGYLVELASSVENAEIRYAVNGLLPHIHSPKYQEPVFVNDLSDFRAITVVSSTHFSLPLFFPERYEDFEYLGAQAKKLAPREIGVGDFRELVVDVTGKVSQDGDFVFSLAGVSSGVDLMVGDIELYKRDEKIGTSKGSDHLRSGKQGVVSRTIRVEGWQAGTPFTIRMKLKGAAQHSGNVVVFVKKGE